MADRWTVFGEAVRHSLEGWPALHLAKQQRLGGENVMEKLEWLLEVIVQVFRNNDHVYPAELEDYISECLYNEFDMIVEDGTTQKLVEKICRFDNYCSSGKIAEIIEELKVPPPNVPAIVSHVTSDDASDEEESESSSFEQKPQSSAASNLVNTTDMEIDETSPMEMENGQNDDGWEVVKKSKKKKNRTL